MKHSTQLRGNHVRSHGTQPLSPNWQQFRSTHTPASDMWVKLNAPLSQWCYDEALLLAQGADREWIAWIPDYGEARLTADQFEW